MYLRAMFLISIALISIVLPDVALAQANLFEPVAGDKSIEMLQSLFGGLGSFNSGSSSYATDAFADVIASFNAAVLVLGGLLVSYTIFIGTIGTAHDGEMLGKKFSSAWVPIRTALGTSLVLPVIGGSYCVMQAIVGWLVVQGIGLADKTWEVYMSSSSIAKQVSLNATNFNKDYRVGWSIFSSAVCTYGYEQVINEVRAKDPLAVSNTLSFGVTSSLANTDASPEALLSNAQIYYYGASSEGDGFKQNSCGSASFSKTDATSASAQTASSPSQLTLFDYKKLDTLSAQARVKQEAAFEKMRTSIEKAAKDFVASPSTSKAVAAVKDAVATYSKSNTDAAAGLIAIMGNFDELESSAKKDGWALAGAWYMRMSYLMDATASIMGKSPEATGANMGTINVEPKYADLFLEKYGEKLTALSSLSDGQTGVNAAATSQSATTTTGATGMWDFIKSGFNVDTLIKKAINSMGTLVINDNDHPIIAMKGVGAWLLGGASLMFTSFVTAMAALGMSQGTGVSLSVSLLPFTMMIFPILFSVGFTLEYVLPMMPFMIWIGVVLGWLILVVQAIIAAPMWAVMHLSPHGDDMVGTGGQGYKLVLSLILRPVLMIFGLIAALTIITVFGKMLNGIFYSVFMLSQQDTNIFVMIGSIIAAPILYMGLMWTLITKTMSIIHVMPDELLQWFGGGGSQLGDYGRTFGDRGSQTFAAAGAFTSLGGSTMNAAKNSRDLKLQEAQVAKQTASVEGDKMARAKDSVDKRIGAGASSLQELIMNKNGYDGNGAENFMNHSSMQEMGEIEKTGDSLGSLGQDYRDNLTNLLSDPSNKDKTFAELNNMAVEQSVSNVHGVEAGRYVAGSSNKLEAISQVNFMSNEYRKLPPGILGNGQGKTEAMNKAFLGVNSSRDFSSMLQREGIGSPAELVGPQKPNIVGGGQPETE